MTDLANRDQALKLILEECGVTNIPEHMQGMILDAMRRAYALAESKEELAKRFEP